MQHRTGTDPQGTSDFDERADLVIEVQNVAETLTAKTFSSGSRGFWTQGRVQIGAKRFIVNIQAVEIGSRPQS